MDAQIYTGVLGYCDRVSPASVEGWAYNQAAPDTPLVMQVLIDGRRLCSITCDLVRQDVTAAGYRSRNVGFHVAIPPGLRKDRDHRLEFRDLDGNPILLQDQSGPRRDWVLPKAAGRPRAVKHQDVILGSLDPVLDGEVRGWRYRRSATEAPVVLDIFIDGGFQLSVTCDAERVDVT